MTCKCGDCNEKRGSESLYFADCDIHISVNSSEFEDMVLVSRSISHIDDVISVLSSVELGSKAGILKQAAAAKNTPVLLNVLNDLGNYCDSTGKQALADFIDDTIQKIAAEYQGRKVTLNKPFRTPDGPKKFSVYVKNDKDNVVKVNFGDPDMKIRKSDPKRRKSFRARHNCDDPGPKWKARYWSCRAW